MHAQSTRPSLPLVVAAFAAVYVIWGSTYLAIRYAIESLPPFTMAALRFVVAGTSLVAWAAAKGAPRPTGAQWRSAVIVGALMLAGGNGAVVIAEQWVPSGLVALLVATVPIWMVVIDTLFATRERPTGRVVAGLALGLGGVFLLAGSPGVGAGGPLELFGGALVLAGSLSWAAGSIVSRRVEAPPGPRMWVGMQMLGGAGVLAVLATVTGELADFDPAAVTARSFWALVYLVVFGAIIGYTAYIWLLTVTTPARAGTYAYVNPVVALLLGWWLADEPLTFRSLVAAAIILVSVVIITTGAERSLQTRGAARSAERSSG